jgi:hypothetical protein
MGVISPKNSFFIAINWNVVPLSGMIVEIKPIKNEEHVCLE